MIETGKKGHSIGESHGQPMSNMFILNSKTNNCEMKLRCQKQQSNFVHQGPSPAAPHRPAPVAFPAAPAGRPRCPRCSARPRSTARPPETAGHGAVALPGEKITKNLKSSKKKKKPIVHRICFERNNIYGHIYGRQQWGSGLFS